VKRPKVNCSRWTETSSKFEMKKFSTYFELSTPRSQMWRAVVAK
jgi:hypothetical protein